MIDQKSLKISETHEAISDVIPISEDSPWQKKG